MGLQASSGEEQWSAGNGDISGDSGNTNQNLRYIDSQGLYCNGAGSGLMGNRAIPDRSVVWVYRPKN